MPDTALNRFFDLKRFFFLLRYELYKNYRTLIVILATAAGIVFTVSVLSGAAAPHFRIHEIFYPFVFLMAGGFIFSSLAFKETHESGSALRFLTLPCSRLEKTIAKFALTAVGCVLLSIAACFLTSLAAIPLALLISGRSHGLFNPFTASNLRLIGIYLIVQSVFVFGSLFFKKAAFAKTILSLLALALGLAVLGGLVFALTHLDLILRGAFADWGYSGESFNPGPFSDAWASVTCLILQILAAPFFWVLTYIRLKEQEVLSV